MPKEYGKLTAEQFSWSSPAFVDRRRCLVFDPLSHCRSFVTATRGDRYRSPALIHGPLIRPHSRSLSWLMVSSTSDRCSMALMFWNALRTTGHKGDQPVDQISTNGVLGSGAPVRCRRPVAGRCRGHAHRFDRQRAAGSEVHRSVGWTIHERL